MAAAAAQPSLRPARSPPRQWRPRRRGASRRWQAPLPPAGLRGRCPEQRLAAGGAWPGPRPPRIRAHSWLTAATRSSPPPPPRPAPPTPAAQSPGVPWQVEGAGRRDGGRAGRRSRVNVKAGVSAWGRGGDGPPAEWEPSAAGAQVGLQEAMLRAGLSAGVRAPGCSAFVDPLRLLMTCKSSLARLTRCWYNVLPKT